MLNCPSSIYIKKHVINASKVAKVIDKSAASAYKLLRDFESLKILNEITGLERKRLYVFTEYLDLFTKNEKH